MQIRSTFTKIWHRRNNSTIVILLFLSVFLTTYPRYLEFLLDPSPATTYHYYFEKIRHPFSAGAQVGNDTHGSKIAFRLTVPLIGKALGIGSPGSGKNIVLLYLLQSALLLPFLYMLVKVLQRCTTQSNAYLFAVAFAFIYPCKAFFWDYDFWFDGYAYFFMLAGLYFRRPLPIFISLLIACWTDERAVIALPGILLYHLSQSADFGIIDSYKDLFNKRHIKNVIPVILAGLAYLGLRFYLGYKYNLNTPSGDQAGVSLRLIPYQLNNRLIGIFLSFEALWIFPLGLVFYHFLTKKLFVSALLGALLIQIVVAYSVFDISRSLGYAFPVLITSFALIEKNTSSVSSKFLPIAALACILIPTQYLIYFPRQIPTTLSSIDQLISIAKHVLIGS